MARKNLILKIKKAPQFPAGQLDYLLVDIK